VAVSYASGNIGQLIPALPILIVEYSYVINLTSWNGSGILKNKKCTFRELDLNIWTFYISKALTIPLTSFSISTTEYLKSQGVHSPEDSGVFYEPVLTWIEHYKKDPNANTEFVF
jgi:hypothetical protein